MCAAALLLPLWIVEFPPLLDYPSHLATTFAIQHLHDPEFRFAAFYRAEWHAYPNLLLTVLLLALGKFMSMELAGRLVLSVTALALPLSAWLLLRVANPAEERQAVWAMLLAYNPMFLRGFINYQLSVAICLLMLAAWLLFLRRPSIMRWLAVLALASLLYFTHLGGFLVAGLATTLYLLFARSFRLLPATWAAFVPGALLYLSLPVALQRGTTYQYRLDEKLEYLFTPFVGYTTILDFGIGILAVSGLVFCWLRNRERKIDARWLAIAAVLLVVYWFSPSDPGTAEAPRRLTPFILLFLLLAAELGEKGRVLLAIGILAVALRLGDVAWNFVRLQPRLHALAQAFPAAPRNARVLELVENWREPEFVKDSAYHFCVYGGMRRGWLLPSLFARPDIHVLRLDPRVYVPRDRTGFQYYSTPDWAIVRRDYDYVWAYGVPQFEPTLNAIGKPVFSSENFTLFKIEPAATPSGARDRRFSGPATLRRIASSP